MTNDNQDRYTAVPFHECESLERSGAMKCVHAMLECIGPNDPSRRVVMENVLIDPYAMAKVINDRLLDGRLKPVDVSKEWNITTASAFEGSSLDTPFDCFYLFASHPQEPPHA